MHFTLSSLALVAAASALPNWQGRGAAATSNAFTLMAHVPDPNIDLDPSVEGLVLSSAHTGAGTGVAVFTDGTPRLFYQNGTAGASTLLTDSGSPPFPSSLQLQGITEPRTASSISIGQGSPAYVGDFGTVINGIEVGTFLACPEVVPYYNQTFITLQYVYGDAAAGDVPGCAIIDLQAKCDTLNDLPEGSISNHDFATDVVCQ